MDTTKKIIIGAIGAAVVVGAVSIGLIFGLAPADTDLSPIRPKPLPSLPKNRKRLQRRKQLPLRLLLPAQPASLLLWRPILPEIFPFNIRW